jgi:hypothetical protein
MPKLARRGYDPVDDRIFGASALPRLRAACQESEFLLDRGYPADTVSAFTGGHHQLAARQRLAVQRSAVAAAVADGRRMRQLSAEDVRSGPLLIDGFNVLITLEVVLCGGLLIRGRDGALRDLAGLRGTYRLIPQTDQALQLLGAELGRLLVPQAVFYLDAPVSNSGRLCARILAAAEDWALPVTVELVPDADRPLSGQPRIASSDSLLLDRCQSWFNLTNWIVNNDICDPWIVDLHAGSAG